MPTLAEVASSTFPVMELVWSELNGYVGLIIGVVLATVVLGILISHLRHN